MFWVSGWWHSRCAAVCELHGAQRTHACAAATCSELGEEEEAAAQKVAALTHELAAAQLENAQLSFAADLMEKTLVVRVWSGWGEAGKWQ